MTGFTTADYAATFSGKQLDLDYPSPADIELIDIAVGLANQCRYAGQVWPFYSIAEHSVLTSFLVPDVGDLRLKALMHDATEFVLHDLIRPVKHRVSGYDTMENSFHRAVEIRFGLTYSSSDWEQIKQADNLITIRERRDLMPRVNPESYGRGVKEEDVPKVSFTCHPPLDAAVQFLSRYFFLTRSEPTKEQREWIDILLQSVKG